MKTIYVPVNDLRPIDNFLSELKLRVKSFNRIAITSTTQFKQQVNAIAKELTGHEIIKCAPVLGCSELMVNADCIVLITTGLFHAINLAVKNKIPVFIIGPEGINEVTQQVINDFLKKQSIRVSKVLDAKVIGVLASTKSGQNHEPLAKQIIAKLESLGKEAYLFIANELSPSQLNDFPVDAWINTACPRIVEDTFDKPIANWNEVEKHL
ncbi:MAG: diphthamide synthesis protein [Candidatus Nanoarchaeia archaeon]|jgi:2-(3-amino-3-carboxypropyl)histidine synthase